MELDEHQTEYSLRCHNLRQLKPFHVTGILWYPLKPSENQRFSDAFKGYRKRPVAWNGLSVYCNKFQVAMKQMKNESWWWIINNSWCMSTLPIFASVLTWTNHYRYFQQVSSFSENIFLNKFSSCKIAKYTHLRPHISYGKA